MGRWRSCMGAMLGSGVNWPRRSRSCSCAAATPLAHDQHHGYPSRIAGVTVNRRPAAAEGGVVPLIQQLNAQTDEWRALELARARKRLAKGDDVDAVLEALSRGLTQKMLHGAMAELRATDTDHREQASRAIERLFLRAKPR